MEKLPPKSKRVSGRIILDLNATIEKLATAHDLAELRKQLNSIKKILEDITSKVNLTSDKVQALHLEVNRSRGDGYFLAAVEVVLVFLCFLMVMFGQCNK
jgi:hypothetical protein